MSDTEQKHGRAHIMLGGKVDGTQYYVVHARDLMGRHSSAAVPSDDLRELIDMAEKLLEENE